MSPLLFRLVLLVSCAHALVHVYELAFSSVEQLVADDFHVGTAETGELARNFRLPFGLLAIGAGLLTDWIGARRMLMVYLVGCGLASLAISQSSSLTSLGWTLFLLGSFASIYHPAGLALLSQQTSQANRPRALGLHGIFGSLGIGGAPFLAGVLLPMVADDWRHYYLFLTLPGLSLALAFFWKLNPVEPETAASESAEAPSREGASADFEDRDSSESLASPRPAANSPPLGEEQVRWGSFVWLAVFGALSGFIYAPFVTFLPRYIHDANVTIAWLSPSATWNFVSGMILMLGLFGQYTAGRIARPHALEPLLAKILLLNAPLLAWMALSEGGARIVAAGLFALVHFMNQPIYNSLIASYTPRRWRSLCYGFSFMTSFGVGSLGPWFIGHLESARTGYLILAVVALAAAFVAGVLVWLNRSANRPA